jgi:hypothetical protein
MQMAQDSGLSQDARFMSKPAETGNVQHDRVHLRTEELSLRLFMTMAEKIRENPDPHLSNAKRFIEKWRDQHPGPGGAAYYFNRWELLLDGPLNELLDFMVSPSQDARDMRQAAPFVHVLSNKERWGILRNFSEEWRKRQQYA